MSMFDDIPVDVGVVYEGERIRRKQMFVELGGPNVEYKFELVGVKEPEEIEDEEITVIGPDLKDMKEGESYPLAIIVEVAGKEVEKDFEGILERRIHDYTNYIQGVMHLNQRYDIWCRVSKDAVKKGLNSFTYIGKVLIRLYKSEFPIAEKIQVTFVTDQGKVKELYEEALKIYDVRDARARGLKDEEVNVFYGCSLCQSFAPTHVCIITPQRYANCGSISWFDGKAAARVDPKGPIYEVPKGECLDPLRGEYTGTNEVIRKKSMGEINRVWLYSAFGYPHTSCGCFEAVAFYVPEVDGLGVVHRGFKDATIIGLTFSAIADSTAGGRQIEGFHGLSIEYMRSPKFLQSDGGWDRIVWLPKELKEKLKDFIPEDIVDKIATEKEATNLEELKEFLKRAEHPVVGRWKAIEEVVRPEEIPAEISPEALIGIPAMAGLTPVFKIVLTGARIKAGKLRLKRLPKKGEG